MFYFLIVVDVSAQSCTITPTSPDYLGPTGGVIPDGTPNVMVQCRCSDGGQVRWFLPNNTRVLIERNTPVGDPYFTNNPSTLVIPTFSDSTSGIYTCGIGNTYPATNNVTINLMLPPGKD